MTRKKIALSLLKNIVIIFALSSCAANNQLKTTTKPSPTTKQINSTLALVANGEDFIRQGFVSKDDWQIEFNHAYVTLNEVIGYQTNPPFNPDNGEELQATESVTLVNQITTIDLAQGDENALPIKVMEVSAPIGNYNAIAWNVVNNPETNTSIILDGVATKNDKTVNFILKFPLELSYLCGEFVGDERKGILQANQGAQLEITFHFDHLFGDAQTSAEDGLNLGAIGFQPLANIATNTNFEVDLGTLEQKLAPQDYSKLIKNLQSLGHVGEGHCRLQK